MDATMAKKRREFLEEYRCDSDTIVMDRATAIGLYAAVEHCTVLESEKESREEHCADGHNHGGTRLMLEAENEKLRARVEKQKATIGQFCGEHIAKDDLMDGLRARVADLERLFRASAWFDYDEFHVEDICPHDGRHWRVWHYSVMDSWDICLDEPLPDDLRAAIDAAWSEKP